MLRAGLCVWLSVLAGAAFAEPITLMACTFKGGQTAMSVNLDNGSVTYDYGPVGQPSDLVLTDAVIDIDYQPWPGVGSAFWEEITFENKGYYYLVSMFALRDPGNPEIGGGVFVFEGETQIAQLDCDPGSAIFAEGELGSAKRAAGLCFERDTWIRCPSDG